MHRIKRFLSAAMAVMLLGSSLPGSISVSGAEAPDIGATEMAAPEEEPASEPVQEEDQENNADQPDNSIEENESSNIEISQEKDEAPSETEKAIQKNDYGAGTSEDTAAAETEAAEGEEALSQETEPVDEYLLEKG